MKHQVEAHVHIYIHLHGGGVPPWAVELRDLIIKNREIVMDELNKALDQAEANATRETDAETAIEGILAALQKQIADLKNSAPNLPTETLARIKALSDGIGSRADKLSAAAVANTQAAPST